MLQLARPARRPAPPFANSRAIAESWSAYHRRSARQRKKLRCTCCESGRTHCIARSELSCTSGPCTVRSSAAAAHSSKSSRQDAWSSPTPHTPSRSQWLPKTVESQRICEYEGGNGLHESRLAGHWNSSHSMEWLKLRHLPDTLNLSLIHI